jgi:hypothetical protein
VTSHVETLRQMLLGWIGDPAREISTTAGADALEAAIAALTAAPREAFRATDEQGRVWDERHDLGLGSDARAVFEDAESTWMLCRCGDPACVEPWEPGCGLGNSEAHALVAAEPVAGDAARFRWLTEDHADRETRAKCRAILDRMGCMSYAAACADIDAAMALAAPAPVAEDKVRRVIELAKSAEPWDGKTFNEELSAAIRDMLQDSGEVTADGILQTVQPFLSAPSATEPVAGETPLLDFVLAQMPDGSFQRLQVEHVGVSREGLAVTVLAPAARPSGEVTALHAELLAEAALHHGSNTADDLRGLLTRAAALLAALSPATGVES